MSDQHAVVDDTIPPGTAIIGAAGCEPMMWAHAWAPCASLDDDDVRAAARRVTENLSREVRTILGMGDRPRAVLEPGWLALHGVDGDSPLGWVPADVVGAPYFLLATARVERRHPA